MRELKRDITRETLVRVKTILQSTFGKRFQGVILYGSEARHCADADSDVDFLVLLSGPVERGADSWACIRALYPLVLELERPIHAKPTDVLDYEAQEMPLYRNVSREGVLI